MKENSWYLIKTFLDSHSHEEVIKGIVSHISKITDNEKLDIIYLDYLDNDSITSIFNDEFIQLIEGKDEEQT
ncbi:hypothetical protein [Staphylococcus coagulans]|uniref:hypothetical protein n=1 Tax=Staphylococcus coagulans TaxID=74706 RepID=UPI0015FD88F7|nr:hypothetical protein [Staphylococcus coagulans]MBA8764283.1 hypothetical protein [Staphylococcus coagulans]MBT2810491.1 hypothetical protein [Staphylococcus coagulans]MBT2811885.1 hypothetical protein [Staphylococcus coagulans]MBT2819005.1 hypothetical protein [Staphylococcus coagulans]MBT2821818.1 hypothetical protein [Staphylococcus coagulans]